MTDPHIYPSLIFTNQLYISDITISHTSSDVSLLGSYADLPNGRRPAITIETDFASLNDLLTEAGEEAEEATDQISKCLANPSGDETTIDLSASDGLFITDLLFSFLRIETGEVRIPELGEYTYALVGWLKTNRHFRVLDDGTPPDRYRDRLSYLNTLLTIQYRFYLAYKEKVDHYTALYSSNLLDPVTFNIAKTMYELQKTI